MNGGMDALEILKLSRHKIRHVHFKDRIAQDQWAVMGEGCIDYPAIIRYLEQTGYGGWIMVEDRIAQGSDRFGRQWCGPMALTLYRTNALIKKEESTMHRYTVAVMGLGVRGKIHIHGLLETRTAFPLWDFVT